ncbi:zinc knuckle family protein [Aphelenchoides avenae]|nr:zinc knuckle family protein [Aphelenchus avenae]
MATAGACLHLHEEAQGSTYHGLPICGIGPTGFFLNAESGDTFREYEGQRQALLRFGRIARNTGKCLVLVIYNEPNTGIDLHCEAIRLLGQEVQLPADHPIHLVAYRASALQLQHWLTTFSNVVLGLDRLQLSSLFLALRSTTDRTESHVHALQLQELFTNLPLKHFTLHSGCPSTHPSEHPSHFQTPTTLLMTAEFFEQLTGTPKDVLLARSAKNLNIVYQLGINLPDCTMTTREGRDESRGRHLTEDLSARPHLALGPARRADHADQAIILASQRSPPLNTAHSVVPTVRSPSAARQMCDFCNKAHPPTECTEFQEVNHRMRRLEKLKRCFLCLATGHTSNKCTERTTSLCRYCKREAAKYDTLPTHLDCCQRQPTSLLMWLLMPHIQLPKEPDPLVEPLMQHTLLRRELDASLEPLMQHTLLHLVPFHPP